MKSLLTEKQGQQLRDLRLEVRRRVKEILGETMDATVGALITEDTLGVWKLQEAQEDAETVHALTLLQELTPHMTNSQRERFRRTARNLLRVDDFEEQLRRQAEVATENTLAHCRSANGMGEELFQMMKAINLARQGVFTPIAIGGNDG